MKSLGLFFSSVTWPVEKNFETSFYLIEKYAGNVYFCMTNKFMNDKKGICERFINITIRKEPEKSK